MATANERQIGGDHYKGAEYQHWDWIAEMQMSYHAAVATKYIYRWRNKGGKEDLEKAIHYIDKCEELKIGPTNPIFSSRHRDKMVPFWRFVLENHVPTVEAVAIWYVMEGEWEAARLLVQELLTQTA